MVNKKKSDNKWLILLIVIVVLSLVVDLLSLNVLYSLKKSQMSGSLASLKGELAAYSPTNFGYYDWYYYYYEDYYYCDPMGKCKERAGPYEDPWEETTHAEYMCGAAKCCCDRMHGCIDWNSLC